MKKFMKKRALNLSDVGKRFQKSANNYYEDDNGEYLLSDGGVASPKLIHISSGQAVFCAASFFYFKDTMSDSNEEQSNPQTMSMSAHAKHFVEAARKKMDGVDVKFIDDEPRQDDSSFPNQPIIKDHDGTRRFKQNGIVRFLLNAGPFSMNTLQQYVFDDADRAQFAQLIGYSVSGWEELDYTRDYRFDSEAIVEDDGLDADDRDAYNRGYRAGHRHGIEKMENLLDQIKDHLEEWEKIIQ